MSQFLMLFLKADPFASPESLFIAKVIASGEAAVRARGGYCHEHPTRDLNYLVVGSFAEPAWAHKTFGRKIEQALELKQVGVNCKIISEDHWTEFLQNVPELPLDRQTPIQEQT